MKIDEYLRPEGVLFLTCPFTSPDPDIERQRFIVVSQIANNLTDLGYKVFSPVTQNYVIDQYALGTMRDDEEYWEQYARTFLNVSRGLVILRLDGWEHSNGLVNECKLADELHVQVIWIDIELNVLEG